ncbi:MAG: hypothetical protein P8181_06075 [bacterium]
MDRPKRIVQFGIVLAVASLVLSAAVTERARAAGDKSTRLSDLGLEFDRVMMGPVADRAEKLGGLAASLDALMKDGLEKDRKAAAYFLSGEIRFALGDFDEAAESYKDAFEADKKGAFADDAEFAEILAIEAQGQDDEAEKSWHKWEKHHEGSPLVPEVCLARTWNALRRNSLREAAAHLSRIDSDYSYMKADPRVCLARAAVAYKQGDADGSLAALADTQGAPESYLRGLAYQAKGEMLKAAAQFQAVVERYPQTSLRDHAMIAKADVFLESGAYRTAAEEFEMVAAQARNRGVIAQAELRRAACVFLDNDLAAGTQLLRVPTKPRARSSCSARSC